jgi:spermidine/putrescine transport system permease protein
MRAYAVLAYCFLYLPIALIVAFSFNSGSYAMDWQGFSLEWYGKAFSDPLIIRSLLTSVGVATLTSLISTVVGTMTALGMERASGSVLKVFEALIYIAIIVPGIVIGISTLITLVTMFNFLNPFLLSALNLKLGLGVWSIVAAHVLFGMAIVTLLVKTRMAGMDRSLVEASEDLYASPWRTFWQVIVPSLRPSIVAGGLLAFVFSFDDFAVAYFVAGPNSTLPIYVFASVRRGVTPEINAVGAVMLITSLSLLFAAQFLLRRGGRDAA